MSKAALLGVQTGSVYAWVRSRLFLARESNSGMRVLDKIETVLKGQCHEIFDNFCLKDSTWAPYEQTKTVSRTFSYSSKFNSKVKKLHDHVVTSTAIRCPLSQRLRRHCVHVVSDYFSTCLRSTPTRVRVVNTYVDTQFSKFNIKFLWVLWVFFISFYIFPKLNHLIFVSVFVDYADTQRIYISDRRDSTPCVF